MEESHLMNNRRLKTPQDNYPIEKKMIGPNHNHYNRNTKNIKNPHIRMLKKTKTWKTFFVSAVFY